MARQKAIEQLHVGTVRLGRGQTEIDNDRRVFLFVSVTPDYLTESASVVSIRGAVDQ